MSSQVNYSSIQHKETVRAGIHAGAELSVAFILMNILAATIASYGLFANSPAVVIGAMIIAMLLGPITGISLALVDNDLNFLWKSILTLLAGALVVIATGFIIGLIHKDVPISREILARTAPNLADLVIALAGGAAGAYATVSPRLSVAFVGVAIATALVPPLCAANILFARGEMALGSGALLLTFTNIVAIQFASSVVFWFTGFREISRTKGLPFLIFLKNNAVSVVILCVLAFILTDSLHEILAKRLYESATQATLFKEIDSSVGNHLVEVRFEETVKDKNIIRAVVRGPNPPTGAQVATLESKLPATPKGKSAELRIRFVPTIIITKEGQVLKDADFTLGE
ncbi:MAG: DUF389 domain-containing protein [Desulfobulbaceae bacterium]|nr:DUF389 domain-containing protein [Desulfobulbaceae bacterium]